MSRPDVSDHPTIHEYEEEAIRITKLAWVRPVDAPGLLAAALPPAPPLLQPLMLQSVLSYSLAVISVAFTGHLGADSLSAGVLGTSLYNITVRALLLVGRYNPGSHATAGSHRGLSRTRGLKVPCASPPPHSRRAPPSSSASAAPWRPYVGRALEQGTIHP